MNVRILAAGKLKDRFYQEAAAEYAKRLSRFCTLELVEVADEKAPVSLSPAGEAQAMAKEGERLLSRIHPGEHVIALCVGGKR